MSKVDLLDKDGNTYRPDVFTRSENGVDVLTQAVANVDPTTGTPTDFATEATLAQLKTVADSLLIASNAIKTAAEGLNSKATTINTGAIAGSVSINNLPATQAISGQVSLDGSTLAALETINANTGGLTNAELRASSIPVSLSSSPLPNDASTLTKQEEIRALIALLLASLTTIQGVTTKSDTDNISGEVDLSAATISALTSASGLTNAQLREQPLDVESATLNDVLTSINTLNDTMVYVLSAIFEKMPRVTANDQAAIALETGTLSTVTTVTTVGTVSNQSAIGGQEALTAARAQMMQGASHIYNNINVS